MIYFSIILFIILIDQISKKIITKNFKYNEQKEIIKNKFYLTYIENKGAAYGLFKGKPNALLKFNILILISFISLFFLVLKASKDNLLKLIFSFIIGGAIGNIIDRVKKGSVTDFIYFKVNKAPIFNFADLFLFFSAILIIIREIKNFK